MTINITPPPTSPGSPNAALVAGGSLVDGRQYFFRIACRTLNQYSVTSINQIVSAPCAEVNATCDSTNKTIRVTWTAGGAGYYYLYVRWGSENWKKVGGASYSVCTTTSLTYDFSDENDTYTQVVDLFAIPTAQTDIPFIDKDTGVGVAAVSGTETLSDIIDAIEASYPGCAGRAGTTLFVTRFHIVFTGTGSSEVPTGAGLLMMQCVVYNESTNFTWTWKSHSYCLPTAWSHRMFSSSYNTVFETGVVCQTQAITPYIQTCLGADIYFRFYIDQMNLDNVVVLDAATVLNTAAPGDPIVIDGMDIGLGEFQIGVLPPGSGGRQLTIKNAICSTANHWYSSGYDASHIDVRDCKFSGLYSAYGVRFLYTGTSDFLYTNIDFGSNVIDNDPNQPRTLYGSLGVGAHAAIRRSITLKVNDVRENDLTSASVKIYDKDDNLLVDTTTDGNGEIAETDLTVVRTSYLNDYASTYEHYEPFTLVIQKDGYRTYTSVFMMPDKISATITLEDLIPENEIAAILEDGTLNAVLEDGSLYAVLEDGMQIKAIMEEE